MARLTESIVESTALAWLEAAAKRTPQPTSLTMNRSSGMEISTSVADTIK